VEAFSSDAVLLLQCLPIGSMHSIHRLDAAHANSLIKNTGLVMMHVHVYLQHSSSPTTVIKTSID